VLSITPDSSTAIERQFQRWVYIPEKLMLFSKSYVLKIFFKTCNIYPSSIVLLVEGEFEGKEKNDMSGKRILVVLCLVVLAFVGLSTHVYAKTSEHTADDKNFATFLEVEPFWVNTAFMSINLQINNNGRVTMSGSVVGNVGTTSITVNAVLERVNPNGTFAHIVRSCTCADKGYSGNAWSGCIMGVMSHSI